ncbi:PAS domain-containing protein [bacterium]|nr:PAS domain-containing protein [bacterium]
MTAHSGSRRQARWLLLAALIIAGYCGNEYSVRLFAGYDYVFGTVAVLMVVALYGTWWGIAAALGAALQTCLLWGHPYAMVWYVAEAAFVGWCFRRWRTRNLVIYETFYWALIGGPLILVIFLFVLRADAQTSTAIFLKQWVNGIANAFIANALLAFVPFHRWAACSRRQTEFTVGNMLFNLWIGIVIIPAIILLAVYGHGEQRRIENEAIARVNDHASRQVEETAYRMLGNLNFVEGAAAMLASGGVSNSAVLSLLDTLVSKDVPEIDQCIVVDAADGVRARYGGHEACTCGVVCAHMPGLELVRHTLESVVTVTTCTPPRAVIIASIVSSNTYHGAVIGTFLPGQIPSFLTGRALGERIDSTVLAPDGEVMCTTVGGRTPGGRWAPLDGCKAMPRGNNLYHRFPDAALGMPVIQQWAHSSYALMLPIHGLPGWQLVAEMPLAQAVTEITQAYLRGFAAVLVLVVAFLFVAYEASVRLSAPIVRVTEMTTDLPRKVQEGIPMEWPRSAIAEISALIGNFRHMTAAFARQFSAIREMNESLEARVEARTSELIRLNASVRKSEERLELALEASHDGLWDWDIASGTFYLSPRSYTMLGFLPGEFPASFDAMNELVHPDDRQRMLAAMRRHFDGEADTFESEYRMRTKQGGWLWVLGCGRVVRHDNADRPSRMVGTYTDIDAHKKDEEERARLQAQLLQAQKLESIGRLAGGVAHDFNNLLSPVLGYAEMLLPLFPKGSEEHDLVSQIEEAGRRAAVLTRHLLAFSRNQVLDIKPIDLNAVTAGFESMLKRIVGEDIRIVVRLDAARPVVRADVAQIEQVLMNLVVNARDAMPDGGTITIETGEVTLDEAYCASRAPLKPGRYVMLAVTDAGCGIQPEIIKKIFDPFFTTKETGKGTGLGLATVYGIATQHGGDIRVISQAGHGARFELLLPPCAHDGAMELDAPSPGVCHNGSETILVTEDDEALNLLTARILTRSGYNVLRAHNGDEAIQCASSYNDHIHLLLTDVIMPGMDGAELYRRFRGIHPETSVLFMSGYTGNVIRQHGIDESTIRLVPKPFTIPAILAQVRAAIDDQLSVIGDR